MNAALADAREALRRGDDRALSTLLGTTGGLVHARWPGADVPYDGYFHRSTLLHHVSGNPLVDPVPPNAVELARLLVQHGADVDAVTEQGPSQPGDIGWTTLGLVATSAAARTAGVQAELLEALVAWGADVDARGGGALMGALYYGEAAAAAQLVELGADVDLVAASGLGRLDLVERFVDANGEPTADAHHLVHYSLVPLPERETPADVLGLALCYAVKLGHPALAERLVELGADVDARPPLDHRAAPLHWAVVGDQPSCVAWLLERGADRAVRDVTHHGTPLEWARHLGREACGALLAD